VSIRFERRADGSTDHDVLTKEGALHIITFPPPQDTDTRDERWRDRLKEWSLEHAPGHTAAALRLALGELEA
jgi:hypothetical protein